jgi:branched-subunit amino acid ABC-type transport system permease component
MNDWLPFLVAGVATGSVYSLASMGLVVTYRTSGVFNFAHGAVAMISTYAFYSLRVDAGWPTWLAVLTAVAGVAPAVGILISRFLMGRLAGAGTSSAVVASLGLLVALQGLAVALYGADTRQVAPIFSQATFELPGVTVGYDQVIITVVVAFSAGALAVFFRRSHLGLQTQAVVDDSELAEAMGTDSRRITTFAWMLGCAFAALSGILIVPSLGLDAVLLTLLVVYSFGAVALGGLTSLPRTYAGGLAIGVTAALSTKWVATTPALSGLPTSVPFLVLFVVLLVGGRRFAPGGASFRAERERAGSERGGRRTGSRLTPLVLLGVAVALPAVLSGSRLLTATTTVAFVLVFASLGLLVGLARQTSLCHAVFVVFGATTLGHLQSAGLPWALALVLAGAVMVPVGAFLALPSLRLSSLFLALATFGFGVLAQFLVFPTGLAFGRDAIAAVPRPAGFSGDVSYYWLVVGVVAAGVALIETVRRTRLGRLLTATADSPRAIESLGISPATARVLVFCLTAFLAGIAGGLLGSLTELVGPASFDFFQSLVWITVLVASGPQTLGGAVVAALALHALPAVATSPTVSEWQPVAFGVAAVLLAGARNGLVGLFPRIDVPARAESSRWRLDHRGRAAERVALVRSALR